MLHLHLSEAAIRGDGGSQVGRVENTRSPVTAQTIRDWVGRPDLQVVVKPVVDLAEHVSVEAYEVPDRVAEPVALRDISCVFPWCTRPARRSSDPTNTLRPATTPSPTTRADPPAPCQIAPLCRRHHRLKTHGGWTYHDPRTRVLPVDQPPPLPIPPRPHRHPRRLPRQNRRRTTRTDDPARTTRPRPDHPAPHPPHPRRALRHVKLHVTWRRMSARGRSTTRSPRRRTAPRTPRDSFERLGPVP